MANFAKIQISETIDLGTLSAGGIVTEALTADTASQGFRCTSAVITWAVNGLTAGQGPIAVGVAQSDYSGTEIGEFMNLATGFTRTNLISQEIQDRRIRTAGAVQGGAEAGINDGKPVKTKLNWLVQEGQTINMFAHNGDDGALTTGGKVSFTGHLNGFWVGQG